MFYFVADTHFQHGRPNEGRSGILKYTDRPWNDVDAMDEGLMKNWNDTVTKRDTVFIVGDFAFRNARRWLNLLHGTKILIRGNHDEGLSAEDERHFSMVRDLYERKFNLADLKIVDPKDRLSRVSITFCHYAMRTWRHSHSENSWHLYGHSHGMLPENPMSLSFDIGMDVWGWRPVPLSVVAAKMFDKIETRRAIIADRDVHEDGLPTEDKVKQQREARALIMHMNNKYLTMW